MAGKGKKMVKKIQRYSWTLIYEKMLDRPEIDPTYYRHGLVEEKKSFYKMK